MSRKPPPPPDHDEDGRPLAVPDKASSVGQLIYLLEWGRIRGFRLGPTLKVGDLVVQVSDLRQTEGQGPVGDDAPEHDVSAFWKACGYNPEETE